MGSTGYLVYGRGLDIFLNLSTDSLIGAYFARNAYGAVSLVGAPYQILRDEFPPGLVGLISYRVGFFAQDDIKLTRKLTVNVGARYDIMPYPREMHNRLSNFDPATGTMLIAGQNTSQRLVNTDYKDLAPRVGVAYSANEKTVIRAGYGIGFIDPYGAVGALNSNEFNVPFYYVGNITEISLSARRYPNAGAAAHSLRPEDAVPVRHPQGISAATSCRTMAIQYSQTWSFTCTTLCADFSSLRRCSKSPTLRYQREPAVDRIGHQCGSAYATDPTTRQPRSDRRLGRFGSFPIAPTPSITGSSRSLKSASSAGPYFLGPGHRGSKLDRQSKQRNRHRYSQRPVSAGPAQPESSDRDSSSFDRPQVFVGRRGLGNPGRTRPSRTLHSAKNW